MAVVCNENLSRLIHTWHLVCPGGKLSTTHTRVKLSKGILVSLALDFPLPSWGTHPTQAKKKSYLEMPLKKSELEVITQQGNTQFMYCFRSNLTFYIMVIAAAQVMINGRSKWKDFYIDNQRTSYSKLMVLRVSYHTDTGRG